MTRFGLLFILFLLSSTGTLGQVRINEFLSNNSNGLADEDDEFYDWIELYNAGKKSINLEGYSLTDSRDLSRKWVFPRKNLKPGKFLVIFASGKDKKEGKELHTNFSISSQGEDIRLYNSEGQLIDVSKATPLIKNQSFARSEDGTGHFVRCVNPTPGVSNNKGLDLSFSQPSGFYKDSLVLEIIAKKGYQIRYTTDGSLPESSSTLYEKPILIKELQSTPADIGYRKPHGNNINKNPYQKATIIRAAAFKNDIQISQVRSATYLITPLGKERYQGIDLISLIFDPEDLLGQDSGIYVRGQHGKNDGRSGNFFQKGREWEQEANISYFNADGELEFSQTAGVRIHGGTGRVKPQKSFRLYARKEYGAQYFNHAFFERRDHRTFKKIVLRHSMGDGTGSIVKDEFLARLVSELHIDVLEARPVIVYLNGNYWGIYAVREYFDADYIASNYGVSTDSVNIIVHGYANREDMGDDWGLVEGNGQSMKDLYAFLHQNSLSIDSNYSKVCSYLNIESIIDYYCVELYLNNADWPSNNNKLWSVGNGKWSQLLYDVDRTCLGQDQNSLNFLLQSRKRKQCAPYATFLFRKLMESKTFLANFCKRMKYIAEKCTSMSSCCIKKRCLFFLEIINNNFWNFCLAFHSFSKVKENNKASKENHSS